MPSICKKFVLHNAVETFAHRGDVRHTTKSSCAMQNKFVKKIINHLLDINAKI